MSRLATRVQAERTVAKSNVDVHSRDRVRVRHGARPGRQAGQLGLYEVERNFREGNREVILRGQRDVWPLLDALFIRTG
jgi:hypothetical protein